MIPEKRKKKNSKKPTEKALWGKRSFNRRESKE